MSDETDTKPVEQYVPPHGNGRLNRGGYHGGGQKPSLLRQSLRRTIPGTVRAMRNRIEEMRRLVKQRAEEKPEATAIRLRDQAQLFAAEKSLADYLAKYGLGTTFTETDGEGNSVIRVIREPFARISEN
jgi:hypothetical protein